LRLGGFARNLLLRSGLLLLSQRRMKRKEE
jgi:hypothetical protein